MKFTLQAGLVLRHGARTIEVVRLLEGDQVQLEDSLTRKPTVTTHAKLIKRIWSGDLELVSGQVAVDANAAKDAREKLIDIANLPKAWQHQIEYRLRYVKALQAAHVTRGQLARVDSIKKGVALSTNDPSPPMATTVMLWARRYANAGHNPLALLNLGKLNKRPKRLPQVVEQLVTKALREQYFTRARHPLRHAHDWLMRELARMVEAKSLEVANATVSLPTFARRAKEVDQYSRIATREGTARARMVCRTTMDGASASHVLQRVEIDHTPLNWVVICDVTGLPLGRPMLTVAIDAYSGYVLGIYITFYGPGVTSVTGVIRSSLMPKDDIVSALKLKNHWLSNGMADQWILDNGLEFHSLAFKALCWVLGIDITYCRVRTPWLKPHVERFFGELNFLTLAKGRVHKRIANVMAIDPYKCACISFGDLVRGLTMFAVDVHPFQINERKLARPFDLMSDGLQSCPPAMYPGSADNFRLVSGLTKTLTVGPGGVELLRLPFGGAELLDLRKRHGERFKAVCKWDPDDLGSIYVQDPGDATNWLKSPCRWQDYAAGLSWNQHRLIRQFARQELAQKDAREQLWQARMRLHDHWQDATRPRTRADSLLAGRYAGLTSAGVYGAQPSVPVAAKAETTPTPALATSEAERSTSGDYIVPEFDAFDMEDEA